MPTLIELKAIGIITIICGMFFAGYYHGVVNTIRQEKLDEEKQDRANITAANKKLVKENIVDEAYNRQVTTIDTFQDKTTQEINHETDSHNCLIPPNWLHILKTNSSH